MEARSGKDGPPANCVAIARTLIENNVRIVIVGIRLNVDFRGLCLQPDSRR